MYSNVRLVPMKCQLAFLCLLTGMTLPRSGSAALMNDPGLNSAASVTTHTEGDNTGLTARNTGIVRSNGVAIGVGFDQWQYAGGAPLYVYSASGGTEDGGSLLRVATNGQYRRATQLATDDDRTTTGLVEIKVDINPSTLNTDTDWRFILIGYDDDDTNWPTFSNRGFIASGDGTMLLDKTLTQADLTEGAGNFTTVPLANDLSLADADTDNDGDGNGFQNYLWIIEGEAGANEATYFDNFLVLTTVSPNPPTVSIAAEDATALERGVYPGTFRITRTGATTGDLIVNLSYSGNAVCWDDYEPLPDTVTIPNGSSYVDLTVDPVNDSIDELDKSEAVIATVSGGASYSVGSPASATVEITDDETFETTGPLITELTVDSGTAITVHWMDNHEDEDFFTINYTGGSVTNIPANSTHTQVTGLTPGSKYSFTIKAEKDGGSTESWTINGCSAVPLDWPSLPPPYRTFEQYRRQSGLDASNRLVGGIFDNPDGDDKINLMEYLFGSDPLVPDATEGIDLSPNASVIDLSWPENHELSDASFQLMESNELSSWVPSPLASSYANGARSASDTRDADRRFYRLQAVVNAPQDSTATLIGWGDSLTGNPNTWIEKLGEAPYDQTISNDGIGGETSPQIRNRMIGLDITAPFPAVDTTNLTAETPVTIVADRTRVPRIMENAGHAYLYSFSIANPSKVEFFNFGQKIGESSTPLEIEVTSNIATDATRCLAPGHPFNDGDLVHFTDAALPAPLDRYRPYIVRDANSGGFSLSDEDLVYTIDQATDIFSPPSGYPAHTFSNGDVIRFTPAGGPVGFDPDGNLPYYVVNATAGGFQLALSPGDSALTTAYTRTVRMQPIGGTVAALPPLSLTQNFTSATTAIGPFVLNWTHPGGQTSLSLRTHTDRDQATNLIFMGANNSRDATNILHHVREAVEQLKALDSRFLILNVTNSTSTLDGNGDPNPLYFAPQVAYNYWLRQTYPDHFVDVRHALLRAYDSGNPNDVYYRDRDVIPESLRSDPIHFNDAGHTVVAAAVWEKLQERGWGRE